MLFYSQKAILLFTQVAWSEEEFEKLLAIVFWQKIKSKALIIILDWYLIFQNQLSFEELCNFFCDGEMKIIINHKESWKYPNSEAFLKLSRKFWIDSFDALKKVLRMQNISAIFDLCGMENQKSLDYVIQRMTSFDDISLITDHHPVYQLLMNSGNTKLNNDIHFNFLTLIGFFQIEDFKDIEFLNHRDLSSISQNNLTYILEYIEALGYDMKGIRDIFGRFFTQFKDIYQSEPLSFKNLELIHRRFPNLNSQEKEKCLFSIENLGKYLTYSGHKDIEYFLQISESLDAFFALINAPIWGFIDQKDKILKTLEYFWYFGEKEQYQIFLKCDNEWTITLRDFKWYFKMWREVIDILKTSILVDMTPTFFKLLVLLYKKWDISTHLHLQNVRELAAGGNKLYMSYSIAKRYIELSSDDEKRALTEKIEHTQQSILTCQKSSAEDDFTEAIAYTIYPKRNYSPPTLDGYSERKTVLENYTYSRQWYEIQVSGLLGYKLKTGAVPNTELLHGFIFGIVPQVENMATANPHAEQKWEKIILFIEEYFKTAVWFDGKQKRKWYISKTRTLEGKILEYCKVKNTVSRLEKQDMNVILAYQLFDRFKAFATGSNDKLAKAKDEDTKTAVMLDALINEYGDTLKETILGIEKVILKWGTEDFKKDREVLLAFEKESWKKQRIIGSILEALEKKQKDFAKIPQDKLTYGIVKKALRVLLKNIFQKEPSLLDSVEIFLEIILWVAEDSKIANEWCNWEFVSSLSPRIHLFFEKQEKSVINTKTIQTLQEEIYTELKAELWKYDQVRAQDEKKWGVLVEKSAKQRTIMWYFSDVRETALARWVGDVCLWAYKEMFQNPHYFEFVLMDRERWQCVGTVMLLEIEDQWKKYLLYCPNPSEEFTGKVASEELYHAIKTPVVSFALQNNFDGIILNPKYGHATNRAWSFQKVLDEDVARVGHSISLSKPHTLAPWYVYQKDLKCIWKRD